MSHHLTMMSADLKERSPLTRHVLIKLIGLSMVTMFLPALLRFEYGLSLTQIFLLEAFYSLITIVVMYFFSLSFTAHHGTVPSMFLGVMLYLGNFVVLYIAQEIPWVIYFSPLFSGLYVAYFWIGYHTAMAMYTKDTKNNRGSQQSLIESVGIIATMIGPIIGGVLADYVSAGVLYLCTGICLIVSCIPFFFHRRAHHKRSFSAHQSLHRMKKNYPFVKASLISFSSQAYVYFIGSVVWTIVLYSYFGKFTKVALISFFSSILLIVAMRYMGKRFDATRKKQDLSLQKTVKRSFRSQSGTRLFASILLVTGLFSQVFFLCIDTIHKITYKINDLTIMNYFYETIGKHNDMQEILDALFLRELALHGARILFCSILAGITYLFSGDQDGGLILSIFSVFLIAPLGMRLLSWKYYHESVSKSKKNLTL